MYYREDILLKFLILISIVLIFIINYTYVYDDTDWFTSTINNKKYRIRNGPTSIKEVKCNLLANLNDKLDFIIESLSKEQNKSIAVNRLLHNWNRGVVIKEIGNMEPEAAYVINKQYVSICLKNFCDSKSCEGTNTLDNINLLTYVGIHEMAHIMSQEIGHGDEFKTNFKFLLDYSKKLKIYDPLLKKEYPVYIELKKLNTPDSYCGVSIINSIN
jgi:predicted metal-dependent hydrolase